MLTKAHPVTARQWLWFLGEWPEDRPDPTPGACEWERAEDDADAALLHPGLRAALHSHLATDWDVLMWIGEFGHIPMVEFICSYDDPEEMTAFDWTVTERKRVNKWPRRLRRGSRRLPAGPPIRPHWLVVTDAC